MSMCEMLCVCVRDGMPLMEIIFLEWLTKEMRPVAFTTSLFCFYTSLDSKATYPATISISRGATTNCLLSSSVSCAEMLFSFFFAAKVRVILLTCKIFTSFFYIVLPFALFLSGLSDYTLLYYKTSFACIPAHRHR